jgi:hypothetical protein
MPLPFAATFWLKLLGPLISRARRDVIRKFMGYVVFEPTGLSRSLPLS